jgi:dolichyl-diphosphooligosaccharide--protein glycosyltransferase
MQNNIYNHSIVVATQIVELVNRMKWLKKNSSDNEQITKEESQPEPGQEIVETPEEIYAPEPETLEQPVTGEIESAPATKAPSGRRREKRAAPETKPQKKTIFSPLMGLKNTWIGQNWKVFAILFAIFCLAFFVRAYYGLEPATEDGFILSGGSDSYYHHYVITTGSETGDFHFWDDMLNYPVGTRNPRPPLYDWSVTLGGKALAPFFDGDLYTSTFYVFLFSTAFWGALTIFPTYFLGKEAFNRKTGIIAAFLLAVIPGHVQRSVLTNADHDAMTLFFIVTSFFFFLKALKTVSQKDWTVSWEKPKEFFTGAISFVKSNPVSILYSVLAGLSITGVALIWQGFAYAIVLISVYFLVQILINRFRNVDSFGVFVIYFVTVGVGLLFAFPYYYQSIQIPSWFDTPTYFFLAISAFALILMATRKYPWFLVFSTLTAITLLATLILYVAAPSLLDSIVNALLSGGGYFINNKQYQTIAEAQAPPFSNLALSFGVITFWLSFIGVAWAAIQLPKSWKPDFTFVLLWAGTSIYMAVSAARFMFNAAPAFAITSGWVIAIILDKLNLGKYVDDLKRASKPHMTYNFKMSLVAAIAVLLILFLVLSTFSDVAFPVFVIGLALICAIYMLNLIAETNPNRLYNLFTILIPVSGTMFYILAEFYMDWVFTDATHLFILGLMLVGYGVLYLQVRKTSFMFTAGIVFLTFCVVVPNVWAGIDAGIPYETKADYDKQIYNAMPVFLQPSDYDVQNGTNWYLGGFGYSLPLNSRYWPAAYDWLATQDSEIYPPTNRPAFLSWWDYGFEVVNEGQHPTVADNFLGGHQLAGNFIMSQSEEDAIALLCVRILEGNYYKGWIGEPNSFDPEVIQALTRHGIDTDALSHIFLHPSDYVQVILANPDKYGPRDEVIQDVNAKYIASRVLLTQTLDEQGIVGLYNDLIDVTGHSIRYFAIDSRLFPFSAQNTGIFYAPAKLSDHRISETANQPYDFWEIKAVGEFGGEYDLDDIPPDVNLNQQTPYKIVYKDMFYNSMLYKAFIGYSGYDLGQGEAGIPALSGDLSSSQIMPGWNMSHFKLVHRTAYWNPYSANEIQNHTDAWRAMNYWDAYEKQQAGEGISDLSDRSSIYQGTMMLKYYHGAIISGQVTLDDGTPLAGVSVTVEDDFNIPHQRVVTDENGQYSLVAPPGDITITASTGQINPLTMKGTSMNVTTMVIQDYQAMRINEDRNSDGRPDYLIDMNLIVKGSSMSGSVFWDANGDGLKDSDEDIVPNAEISISTSDFGFSSLTIADESGKYRFDSIAPGSYEIKVSHSNRNIGTQYYTISNGETKIQDIPMTITSFTGSAYFSDNTIARGAKIRIWSTEENIEYTTYSNMNGTYIFDNVLHGSFFIQADQSNYASSPQRIEIYQFQNNKADLTLYDSFNLEGILSLNGLPVPYATIKFAGPSDTILVTDSSGKFAAKLNDGQYFIYVSHLHSNNVYSYLGKVYLDDDINILLPMQKGTIVTGHVSTGTRDAIEAQVVFDNLDLGIYISANTNENGDYSIILPYGTYLVQVSSPNYGSYYSLESLQSKVVNLNIVTRPASSVTGSIFWDVDGDNVKDDNEEIHESRIRFTEASGKYAQAITDANGDFTIQLPSTTQYRVTIEKTGFKSVDLGIKTISDFSSGIFQALEPISIPISGTIYLGDDVLEEQNIRIYFTSNIVGLPTTSFQAGRDGSYAGNILPGLYTVSFTHNITIGNDTRVYQIYEDTVFDTGLYSEEDIVLDLIASQRTKISITLSDSNLKGANITFRNETESRKLNIDTNSAEYYLMPGNYVMTAVHPLNDTIMVDMKDITVTDGASNNNYVITLKNGLAYSGTLAYQGANQPLKRIVFNDVNGNGSISVITDDRGSYDVFLVPDLEYEVVVDYVDYETTPYLKAYRYFAKDQKIVANVPDFDHTITLSRETFETEIHGTVFFNTVLASNAEISFSSEFANYTVSTDMEGKYSLNIIPGEYTLYAHHPSSHSVLLLKSFIEIEQTKLDFYLIQGFRMYGTVYYEMNQNAYTSIDFTNSDSITRSILTSQSGYYELWLPADAYTISIEMHSIKNEMDVTYSLDTQVELASDRQMNLPLSMFEERIVFVSFDPNQIREVKTNSTYTYTFQVENMGNIRDTYLISATGGTPEWVPEVSSSIISVEPGNSKKASVSVKVFIPANAKTTQNQLTLTAISQADSTIRHNNVMSIPIIQTHSLSIQPLATSPIFDSGSLKSEFSVVNNGNGMDKITLYIANVNDLQLNGWDVKLGTVQGSEVLNSGTMIVNVSVASGATVNIPVTLSQYANKTSRQANVLIVGYSQMDNSVLFTNNLIFRYPSLQISSNNLTTTGIGVSEVQSGEQITNVGVMAVSVAAALVIFYYARKKRWIR